jgi:hypothetical protein
MVMLVRLRQRPNAQSLISVTLLGMVMLVTELPPKPKIGPYVFPDPKKVTAYPPNTLGIVTAPVAVERSIVAEPSPETVKVQLPSCSPNAV